VARKGREQRKRRGKGRERMPNLSRVYGKHLPPVVAGEFDFRMKVRRPEFKGEGKLLDVTRVTTELDWSADSGTANLKRPDPLDGNELGVHRQHLFILETRPFGEGNFRELWRMFVDGEPPVTLSVGEVNLNLADPLALLDRGKRDWDFRKTKHRKRGWRAHEVAKYVAKKLNVPVGKLARGKEFFEMKDVKASTGLEVIKAAYAKETTANGHNYVVRFRNGKLQVIPYGRPGQVYVIKGIEHEAEVNATAAKSQPITVIVARGRVGHKHVTARVFRAGVVRRFGRIEEERHYGRVKSKAQLRRQAERDLAKELQLNRTADLTLPILPFMEKGATVRWITPEAGWSGKGKGTRDRSYAYVTDCQHTLAGGSGGNTTEIQLTQVDPYLADKQRLQAFVRNKKRKERADRKKKKNG
jgi:hypothetical protein